MSRFSFRSWMDQERIDPATGMLTTEYAAGLTQFMAFATHQSLTVETGKLYCPCPKCKNMRFLSIKQVWSHLFSRGISPGYKVWYSHGEDESMVNFASSSGTSNCDLAVDVDDHVGERGDTNNLGSTSEQIEFGVGVDQSLENEPNSNTVQMVNDVFGENISGFEEGQNRGDIPEGAAKKMFDMLEAAKTSLYSGCDQNLTPLSTATELMNIKTDYNLPERCVDAFADMFKRSLPKGNTAPASYLEVEKLVDGLGLPYQVIDVCVGNCLIYWREDANAIRCRFCRKPRFQETGGKTPVPFKRMWYLPLADRLKRLYQLERTARAMKWHGEHTSNGEITHPSDAKAWKHFQNVYPEFACETRNVYLGLSTDGFSPFGKHGRQYSVWPVILTPYNLPPSMCMKSEFLFLTVLVPGPDHPRRSLDVFLQPLIYELKQLWDYGVDAYDASVAQNFNMKAVLMWTISDFPAYGMLSGWTTHGRLACPYCQDNSESFQLKHGRKTSWFDCHRRHLPMEHPYRRNTTLFTKGRKVMHGPPPEIDGQTILTQLRDFGAEETVVCGGNGHSPMDGVGEHHNWHKKSIFWDLPYWKTHVLRHCLDVMHIEKNVFENIINTILNVPGKTKDNLKSRLDLPAICVRPSLHIVGNNGGGNVPIFRLDAAGKEAFFDWIEHKVKFPDGYASNLRNCIDSSRTRFTNMKSHDCHVVMQRLFPFAFRYLLPPTVHEAIAGVGAFFRDLCSRNLTEAGIRNLTAKIPVILCNLEKIFPPSFFDVMEHLPIHLPHEADLGGPVQYRWMYPFERYMYHLKKKVKNLSRVEGSIVAQSINEERSKFAAVYFNTDVQTKSRRLPRHDDGGVRTEYNAYAPAIFTPTGRLCGKAVNRKLTTQEIHHLHMYLATNCDDIRDLERLYMAQIRSAYEGASEESLNSIKEKEYTEWLQFYVQKSMRDGASFPTWLEEFVMGPVSLAKSYQMYATRGYLFRIIREGMRRPTCDYGVSAKSGDTIYYGVIREILEVHYPGLLDLKCIIFKCDWYDPTIGTGVLIDEYGVTSINTRRKLQNYDPFILGSQADQVCYLPYPIVGNRSVGWITVTNINPRERLNGSDDHNPMQQNRSNAIGEVDISTGIDLTVHVTQLSDATLHDISDRSDEEFTNVTETSSNEESESD